MAKRNATLEVHHRLHDGIYRSDGGGQDRVVWTGTWRQWPRCVREYGRIRQDAGRAFGSIGMGRIWVVLRDGDESTDVTASASFEWGTHETGTKWHMPDSPDMIRKWEAGHRAAWMDEEAWEARERARVTAA